MTDAATEARAREILAEYTYNPDLAASLRTNAPGCASGTVNTSTALRAIEEALSTPTPAGELREVVRLQGQREGWAAAQQWLRDRGAQKPRASLWDAAATLADQMDHIHRPGSALAQPGSGEGV